MEVTFFPVPNYGYFVITPVGICFLLAIYTRELLLLNGGQGGEGLAEGCPGHDQGQRVQDSTQGGQEGPEEGQGQLHGPRLMRPLPLRIGTA